MLVLEGPARLAPDDPPEATDQEIVDCAVSAISSRVHCPECRLWLSVNLPVAYVASFPHAWLDEIGEHLLEVDQGRQGG